MRSPGILYGTAWKKADTAALVSTALHLGFRGIDTACQPRHYNEAGVGAGMLAGLHSGLARAELFVQTKFTPVSGQDPATIPYDRRAPLERQVAQSLAASLRNLQTDYVDSLILHSPLASAEDTLRVWRKPWLLGQRTVGRISDASARAWRALWRAARVKPAAIQNRFHAETHYDREIRAFCRTHAMSYQSFWTLTANPQLLAHSTVTALASRYGRTPAQILFRYLTQSEVVPLTGTRSEVHMRQDLAIFEFELNDGERDALTAAL